MGVPSITKVPNTPPHIKGVVNIRGKVIPIVDLTSLSPGGSERELLGWMREQREDATIVLVGHEPDLGLLASWLLTGKKSAFTPLRKGAACLIRFAETPVAGSGVLEWMLTPKLLDKL